MSDNTISWMSKEEYDKRQEWVRENEHKIIAATIWGIHKPLSPKDEKLNRVKLAYVFIGDNHVMMGVDNQTMEGYKLREDMPTIAEPLVPQAYDRFDRWCRSMDL